MYVCSRRVTAYCSIRNTREAHHYTHIENQLELFLLQSKKAMTTSTAEILRAQLNGASATVRGFAPRGDKVTVVGDNRLAVATLFALVAQKVSKEIVIIDTDLTDITADIHDIQDASIYMGNPNIIVTTDWENCRNSRLVILALGDEIGLDLELCVRLVRQTIQPVLHACPGAILLVATRPSDILAWCVWRLCAPYLPPHQILGIGCTLETARLRKSIANRLEISPTSVDASVLGRKTPAWSTATACSIRLRDVNPRLGAEDDPEDWHGSLEAIDSLPGVNAVAAAAAHVAEVIIRDTRECLNVATYVSGSKPDPNKDVFMSLPCVVGSGGVAYIVRQALSEEEKNELQAAADQISQIQNELDVS